ncbi:Uncharacterized protein SCF082_LOCUS14196 [Durusdinium trenchii]|uniref:Uncharacterized protein n=1 Tax=Durusdinium trenchii TaxID=1381693 RepID=A0ABP0JW84_9DINO
MGLGVLNSTPDPRAIRLEEEPCALLQQLLKRTGAHLVLTSHWRRHQAYLLEILANYGVTPPPRHVDVTPFNADSSRRDLEILQWLNTNRKEVSEWFVLDSSDLLRFPGPAARLDGHVLHVNGGLSAAAAQAAEAALGATVESPWETVPRRKWR